MPRRAYRGKKQMNKFAFQNNAWQSHLHPLASPPTTTQACRALANPHTHTHFVVLSPPPAASPFVLHPYPRPYFFHSVLSIDQVLNFRVHPSRASSSSTSWGSSTATACHLFLFLFL